MKSDSSQQQSHKAPPKYVSSAVLLLWICQHVVLLLLDSHPKMVTYSPIAGKWKNMNCLHHPKVFQALAFTMEFETTMASDLSKLDSSRSRGTSIGFFPRRVGMTASMAHKSRRTFRGKG
jgi:hypothetical protein